MLKRIFLSIGEFFGVLLYCLKLSWRSSRFYTIVRVFSQIAGSLIAIRLAYRGRDIINLLTGSDGTDREKKLYLTTLVVIYLLYTILSKIIFKAREYASSMQNEKLTAFINTELIQKSVNADISFFDSPKYYNEFESVRRDIGSFTSITWNVMDGVGSFVTLITTFILVSKLNVLFAIALILSAIPSSIAGQQYSKKLYNWGKSRIGEERKMNYYMTISSNRNFAQDIRLFNIGSLLIKRYLERWNAYFAAKKGIIKKSTIITSIISLLPEIAVSSIIILLSFSIIDGKNTIGDYALYTGLLSQLNGSLFAIVGVITKVYDNRLRIENVKRFEKLEIGVQNSGELPLEGIHTIEFNNVSFAYPETEHSALNSVSFKIIGDQKTALVGINGSGKTTIIKLLLRFYDVTSGEIRINGLNIKEYDITSLRKCFSSFFQQVANYSFTLRENITLSDVEKYSGDDTPVFKALELSDAMNILEKASNGLSTYVSKNFEEGGMELSGGQNQKIALARTFFRDSQVIILDEPSASLDPEAEYRIFRSLDKLCEGKTALFTSHRLSNVTMADNIIVIENGVVLEQGTHEELLLHGGRYAQLFKLQAEKYLKVPVKG